MSVAGQQHTKNKRLLSNAFLQDDTNSQTFIHNVKAEDVNGAHAKVVNLNWTWTFELEMSFAIQKPKPASFLVCVKQKHYMPQQGAGPLAPCSK